ncbi:MAG: hypothetical protein Q8O16_05080, partial [Dehalococcoidia bacterium]|nr:hypothetical protein [Dehalococcoidia bacterium]
KGCKIMEAWVTVVVAFIVALSTLGATFLQSRYSAKRFEKEHERAIVTYYRERRKEVRSEPLLKLRGELALMATKGDRLAKRGNDFTVPNKTEEQTNVALEEAIDDWNKYILGDYLQQTLNMQADLELVQLIKEIRNKYVDTYHVVVTYREETPPSELNKARRAAEEQIAPKVAQAQALINKRLEEL